MGTGQARAQMQKAAEALAKSIAEEEASAATGSGLYGEHNEKSDDRTAHNQHVRDLKKRLGNM
eukprot:1210863-Lingulodinium_polyedra.AAC.1